MSPQGLLFAFGFAAASALLVISVSLLVPPRDAAMRGVDRLLAAGFLCLAATATFVIIFRFE
jgi:hypothetical protein